MQIKSFDVSENSKKKIIRGVAEIKTPLKSKMHSRPKAENAEYLNLYLLHKEKDRNLQEMRAISKRQNQLRNNLQFLDEHTAGMLREITGKGEERGNQSSESPPGVISTAASSSFSSSISGKWKTMEINY